VVELANVELEAWTRFDTTNFDVAPDLLGQSHVFTLEGHDISISLPSADRVAGLSERGIETFSDDRVHIRGWHKQDGRPELLAVAVHDVDVVISIPGRTSLPEEARSEEITHDSYSEQQKEHLHKLADDYSNLASNAFDLWIRTLRWKTGNYRIGLSYSGGTMTPEARTEIREKDTRHRLWAGAVTINAYMPVPKKAEVWDMVGAALSAGESPPIYYDLLFSAYADLERGDLQRAIVDAAVAAETYIKTIVYDGLPPDLDAPVREYIERANISVVRERFFPARLDAEQKKRNSTLKPKLEQLFKHRNDIMHTQHKGRKKGLTADDCKTLLKSVRDLVNLHPQ
jgi:hypothetical protein